MSKAQLKLSPDLERKVFWARNQGVIVNREVARLAMNCLDLTSVTGHETSDDIRKLCFDAIKYRLSSVCVCPDKVREASKILSGTGVKTATVINFPYGERRTGTNELCTPETVAEDISKAIAAGATQIDIVQPHISRGGFVVDILNAARMACPSHISLKSILETASYLNAADIKDSSSIAIACGIDCLKTSTSTHPNGGATLEAVAVMLQAIKESGKQVGIKVTGGLKETSDCAQYIALKHLFSGHNSINPSTFRFGGSGLLEGLLRTIHEHDPEADPDFRPPSAPLTLCRA